MTEWQIKLRKELDIILRSNYVDHHVLIEKLETFIQGVIEEAFIQGITSDVLKDKDI